MPIVFFSNCKVLIGDNYSVFDKESGFVVKEGKFHDIDISYKHAVSLYPDLEIVDLGRKLVLPGLIDCHTHLVYGGNRAQEFKQRLNGDTYESILSKGGGIRSTIKSTKNTSLDVMYNESLKRAQAIVGEGVCVLEIKSGYGLDLETEKKQLQVAKLIEDELNIKVVKTFLIHVPPFDIEIEPWLEKVVNEWIPELQALKLLDMVDIFCDKLAFSTQHLEYVGKALSASGIPFKAHIDQLSHTNGVKVAANLGALSLEHLEYSNEDDVAIMAENNTVAVLLPGAYYYLQSQVKPPLELFRKHKVPIAVATDANPGSSPIHSLLVAANLALHLYSMTVDEVVLGITLNAAKALGIDDKYGSIDNGKIANFSVYDIEDISELFYYLGTCPELNIYVQGHLKR